MNSRQGDEEHRIVVGVDGFESSKAALRWAIHPASTRMSRSAPAR